MTALSTEKPAAAAPTTGAVLFERLLREIVSGTYGPGARLPSERDLAVQLGASRPTLREALRRLGEWGLVETRRGSGLVVRPRRDWSLEVLPAYLAWGAPAEGPRALGAVIADLLAVRRGLLSEVLRLIGSRIRPGQLGVARRHVRAAWDARADAGTFVREDFEAMRAIVEAAEFLPALWMLGSLSGVYRAIAERLTGPALAPPDYLKSMGAVLDALEAGRAEAARKALAAYLDRHDRRLLRILGFSK